MIYTQQKLETMTNVGQKITVVSGTGTVGVGTIQWFSEHATALGALAALIGVLVTIISAIVTIWLKAKHDAREQEIHELTLVQMATHMKKGKITNGVDLSEFKKLADKNREIIDANRELLDSVKIKK